MLTIFSSDNSDLVSGHRNTAVPLHVVFLLVALLAAFFGFTGTAIAAAGIAKILFFIFLVIFLVTLIMSVGHRA